MLLRPGRDQAGVRRQRTLCRRAGRRNRGRKSSRGVIARRLSYHNTATITLALSRARRTTFDYLPRLASGFRFGQAGGAAGAGWRDERMTSPRRLHAPHVASRCHMAAWPHAVAPDALAPDCSRALMPSRPHASRPRALAPSRPLAPLAPRPGSAAPGSWRGRGPDTSAVPLSIAIRVCTSRPGPLHAALDGFETPALVVVKPARRWVDC